MRAWAWAWAWWLMNRRASMHWCGRCKEQSVRIKCYTNKKGERKRVMFCLNKGCGYSQDITLPLVDVHV